MFNKRLLLGVFLLSGLLSARVAYAHPMGNFSVNHYSRITPSSDGIEVLYLLDLAEIPAYQEMQLGNIIAKADDPKVLAFVAAQGEGVRTRADRFFRW